MYKIAIWAKIVLNGQIPKGLLIWKSFEFKKPFNYWIIKDGLHKIFLNQSHLVSIIKCHYMYISRLPVLRYCLETPLHPHGLSRLVTSTVFFFCFLNSVKDCLVKKGFFFGSGIEVFCRFQSQKVFQIQMDLILKVGLFERCLHQKGILEQTSLNFTKGPM